MRGSNFGIGGWAAMGMPSVPINALPRYPVISAPISPKICSKLAIGFTSVGTIGVDGTADAAGVEGTAGIGGPVRTACGF
jgi:hypothetical protein